MFQAFANIAKIPELRKKSLITLGLLVFCRIGVFIPLPGIDLDAVRNAISSTGGTGMGDFLGILDMFSGGGLRNSSIFALGIMPYISASIIFQLLAAIVPALQKVSKEGESGRRKITQWTRYSTVVLCIIQAVIICSTLATHNIGGKPMVAHGGPMFIFNSAVILTAGTAFLMWLGEQIDEFGLGNGMSLIIQIGIVSRLPVAIKEIARQFDPAIDATDPSKIGPSQVLTLLALFVFMVVAVVYVTQAEQRVPMQTSRRSGIGLQAAALPAAETQCFRRYRHHFRSIVDDSADGSGFFLRALVAADHAVRGDGFLPVHQRRIAVDRLLLVLLHGGAV